MPEAFKNAFNHELIEQVASHFSKASDRFDAELFLTEAKTGLADLELKQRSNQIKDALLASLPKEPLKNFAIIEDALHPESNVELTTASIDDNGIRGWAVMPIADLVVELALPELFDQGMALLCELTKRFSAEFAVRAFIQQQPGRAFKHIANWCNDNDEHVRRLASEGCRPRLPWGLQLKRLISDPSPLFPVLEQLLDDPSEYVRRSVANNLNDIAKDHPDRVVAFCENHFDSGNKHRTKLFKHACRTLIKQGHPGALGLFGFKAFVGTVSGIELKQNTVQLGAELAFSATLESKANTAQKLVVDYVVYHRKANGQLSPKVFKWKTFELIPGSSVKIEKRHPFKVITTRKYYAGEHAIALQINGELKQQHWFSLST